MEELIKEVNTGNSSVFSDLALVEFTILMDMGQDPEF